MATINDVAKRANVSVGSVSRYLNGEKLKEKNVEKIEEAIHSLGYMPNIIAKGLKTKRSMSIGVLINDFQDIFATSIISALEGYVEKKGYSLIICDWKHDQRRLDEKINFLLARSIDGIITFHVENATPALSVAERKGIPIVAVDAPIQDVKADSVLVNNRESAYLATNELLSLGHKNIGVITGDTNTYVGRERIGGFYDAMNNQKIPVISDYIMITNFGADEAYAKTLTLLKNNHDITALFPTNYYMTMGAVQAIQDLNMRIGKDISLIAFDHFIFDDLVRPQITSIRQPVEEMGELVGRLIIKRIHKEKVLYRGEHICKATLIRRKSLKKAVAK